VNGKEWSILLRRIYVRFSDFLGIPVAVEGVALQLLLPELQLPLGDLLLLLLLLELLLLVLLLLLLLLAVLPILPKAVEAGDGGHATRWAPGSGSPGW